MAIKSKRKSVIKKGTNFSYNPATFIQEHKVENFYTIDDPQEILDKVKPFEFIGRKFIFFDTETHSCGLKSNEIPEGIVRRWVGTGKKATPQDFPFCISIHDGTNAYTIYDTLSNRFAKFKALAPLFEDPTVEKVAHNAKFDMHQFANAGLKIKGKLHDTVVLAKLANENRFSFALMDLAEKLPGGIVKFEYMVKAYKTTYKITDYSHIPRELLSEYANADVSNCHLVFVDNYLKMLAEDKQLSDADKHKSLENLYNQEMELMMALYAMERYGMKSDEDYEKPLKDELQILSDTAEKDIYDTAGSIFNINSTKQLYKVLLDTGMDPSLVKFTEAGNPCLDKKALAFLAANDVDMVQKVLEFRKYEKLLGTYAMGIYEQRGADDRVHGSINQTEATTGRMSITKPALQTLPKKDKRIRKVFIPSEGFQLWFMDLDQVEYRLFAHYAKAEGLIEAIKKGHDVHTATAAILYNKPIEDVSEEERSRAKTINFGLIYGQGDELTASSLKLTLSQARQFKAKYFNAIPEAQPFIYTVQRVVKARGYVKNWYGRKRRLTSNEAYKAPNALIQGCAADYIKTKIVLIYKFLMAHQYKSRMINVVHDELVEEVHESELFLLPKLRWALSEFVDFRVPISAGVDYGDPSWGQKVTSQDVGFEPFTKEELDKLNAYDVFNGDVFDIGR